MAEVEGFPVYPGAELVGSMGPWLNSHASIFIWVADDSPQEIFDFYKKPILEIDGHAEILEHRGPGWTLWFQAPFSPRGGAGLKIGPDPEKRRKSIISLVINNGPSEEVRLWEISNN